MKKFFELATEAAWWTLGLTLLFAFFWFLLDFDLTMLGTNEQRS
jgi:uncharacterized membrane protein YhdT